MKTIEIIRRKVYTAPRTEAGIDDWLDEDEEL